MIMQARAHRARSTVAVVLTVSTAFPLLAHHSFAMFDQSKEVTLVGTVKEFQWTNPHSFIHVEVAAGPHAGTWDIELNSPNNLKRQGWRADSVKSGDKVTLLANPLRDLGDRKGGLFIAVTLPDGTVLGDPTRVEGGKPINVPSP
jgi:hypothetical protein